MKVYTLIHLDDPSGHRLDDIDLDSRDYNLFWTSKLNKNTECRKLIKDIWKPFDMKVCRKRGKPKENSLVNDIYSTISMRGCGNVISNKAKEILSFEFPDEAIYLPINVIGTNEQFWVLWVNNIVENAINLTKSEITEFYGIKSLSWREYNYDSIGDIGMFRLPMIYGETEGDLVTDKFKEVIMKHKLKGFDYANMSLSQK